MKKSIILKVILSLCALVVSVAGLIALFSPEGFTARNGIEIAGNVSLYNDYRSVGGLLLAAGILIWMGVFKASMTYASTIVATVTYLIFSLARVFSIVVDGMPAEGLVRATVVEFVLGVLALFAFIKYREK